MAPDPHATRVRPEYRLGFVWVIGVFLLLLVVMTWFALGYVPVAEQKLAVFLTWLHVVPVAALYLHRRLS